MAGKFVCESGRTLSFEGTRLVCVDIIRNPGSGAYAISPSDADALAYYMAEKLDWDEFQSYIKYYRTKEWKPPGEAP